MPCRDLFQFEPVETIIQSRDVYRKATPNSQTRMTLELAQARFHEHTLCDPAERPFAHPY